MYRLLWPSGAECVDLRLSRIVHSGRTCPQDCPHAEVLRRLGSRLRCLRRLVGTRMSSPAWVNFALVMSRSSVRFRQVALLQTALLTWPFAPSEDPLSGPEVNLCPQAVQQDCPVGPCGASTRQPSSSSLRASAYGQHDGSFGPVEPLGRILLSDGLDLATRIGDHDNGGREGSVPKPSNTLNAWGIATPFSLADSSSPPKHGPSRPRSLSRSR